MPSWLSWIKWQSNTSKLFHIIILRKTIRIFLWKSDICHPSLLTNVHGCFILMSCFILIATPPPRRFCPSWDPNTPSTWGDQPLPLSRASKWCLSLISWNIPELSDSKLLWGGTVRKPPNLHAALGVTPVRPLLVRRETAPRPLRESSKRSSEGTSHNSQRNHTLFSGYNPLPLVSREAGQPTLTGDRTNQEHLPPLGLSWTPSPPPRRRVGSGRWGEDTWSPGYLARGAHRLTDKLHPFTAQR